MTDTAPSVNPTDLDAVTAWFDQHHKALMQRTGAHGAGIGRARRDAGAYAIVLYVPQVPPGWPPEPSADGIPIDFVVSPVMRAQT